MFVLIGAPVGVRSRRGGFGFAMGVSTLVFVFYYLFLTGGEDFADRRLLPAWLSMWMANFVFLAIGLVLLRATTKETGGRLFAHGSIAPLTFDPFFVDLGILLKRQFLLTYLSTHMKRGYHRVEVMTTTPGIEIHYPKGYYYR